MSDLIRRLGGPAKFRRRLAALGVEIPRGTVECWSAGTRVPPAWIVSLVRLVLLE